MFKFMLRTSLLLGLCFTLSRCTSLGEPGSSSDGIFSNSSGVPDASVSPAPKPAKTASTQTPIDPSQLKKRILILPFENMSDFPQEALFDSVVAEVRSAISSSPNLTLVELDAFAPPELTAPVRLGRPTEKQLELAHLLGADAVVTGSLKELQVRQQADEVGLLGSKRYEARAKVWMRVTDVVTQKELLGRDFIATANEERVDSLVRSVSAQTELGKAAVVKALRTLASGVQQVASRIAWTGRIARTDFQKFYITGGRRSGVQPGLLLKVFSPPSEVSDRGNRPIAWNRSRTI